MKNFLNKFKYFILGALAVLAGTVYAVNITVPSAPTNGYALVSTSTGAYVATTTTPFHVGAIYTSSSVSSYFAGNVGIASSSPYVPLGITGALTATGAIRTETSFRTPNNIPYKVTDISGTEFNILILNSSNDLHLIPNFTGSNSYIGFNNSSALTFGASCCGGSLPASMTFNTLGSTIFNRSGTPILTLSTNGTSPTVTIGTTTAGSLYVNSSGLIYSGTASGGSSIGPINTLQASDGAGGFIATGTPQLTVGNFIATSTTATSTMAAAGMWMGPSYDSTYDNLLTLKPGRTYGNSSAAAVKEGVLNIDGTSSGRILLNIMQGSGAGTGSSPEMVNIRNQSTSATGILLKIQTASTAFSGNLGISVQGKQSPAIELNEDIWNGGTNNQGQGLFQIASHGHTTGSITTPSFSVDSRNNTNAGYCSDLLLSSNFATTTYGRFTLFNCTNSGGTSFEGSGRFNVFGTSTVANLMNLTSLQGATEGNLFVVKQSGANGFGTSTPVYALTISSSTAPQLALSAGGGIAQWVFRNNNGNIMLATTTVAGTATTSTSALTINGSSGDASFTNRVNAATGLNSGIAFGVGNDTTINDINVANTLGINGTSDTTTGSVKLGSSGVTITGKSSNFGVATGTPWKTFSVVGTGAWDGLTNAPSTMSSVCIDPTTFEIYDNAASSCLVSLRKTKDNIKTLDSNKSLESIMKLNPREFTYKKTGLKSLGFVAEEVVEVNPLYGAYDTEGKLASYEQSPILADLVATVQLQEEKIDSITGREQGGSQDHWQWSVISLLVLWNLGLTRKLYVKKTS